MAKLPFTIRDIFWMTVVVALLIVWWRGKVSLNAEWEKIRIERRQLSHNWRGLMDFAERYEWPPQTGLPAPQQLAQEK